MSGAYFNCYALRKIALKGFNAINNQHTTEAEFVPFDRSFQAWGKVLRSRSILATSAVQTVDSLSCNVPRNPNATAESTNSLRTQNLKLSIEYSVVQWSSVKMQVDFKLFKQVGTPFAFRWSDQVAFGFKSPEREWLSR